MGNRAYYTFHVYDNNDNYKWDVLWIAPTHYTPNGEYYDETGDTSYLATGVSQTFGGNVSFFYYDDPDVHPESGYGDENVFDNMGFVAAGVDLGPYIGTTTRWYLDRSNQIFIQFRVVVRTQSATACFLELYWDYYRGNTKYFSTSGVVNKNYKSQSGWGYLGTLIALGVPLPDEYTSDPSYGLCFSYADAYMTWNQNDRSWHNSRAIIKADRGFKNKTLVDQWMNGYTPEYPDDDNPYDDLVDDNNKGGSDTNFSDYSDSVTEDSLPTISSVGTGFATLFTPSKTQLRNLSEIFWNSNFFTAMQNLVENITGMFTSLAMVPFTVPAGSTVEVTWLGMSITEVYLTLAAQQYLEFDMGSINLGDDQRIFTYDNCLDYSPFSKLGIYLPFIGYQELDIDECRGHIIGLKYRIDIMSGACVALIRIANSTIYQFTGNCLTQIPITNESIQSLISDAVNVGIAATQAHAARGAVGAAESALSEAESSYKANPAEGRSGIKSAEGHLERTENHLLQTRSSLASATANASMGLKPQFSKTGSVSAAASMLSVRQPYLFLTTPVMSMPKYYEHYAGFPSNITGKLNTFSGFTVVESIRLNGLVATTPEVSEIYDLLHSGVII